MHDEQQQREFWNRWNTDHLETHRPDQPSLIRAAEVLRLVRSCASGRPNILEIGCANGWFSEDLSRLGTITGIDIADASVQQAKRRVPAGQFYAGDFVAMPLTLASFDFAVTLETIASIPDQQGFVDRIHSLLKPGGHLVLTTQNKFVFERREDVGPPEPGQFRNWPDKATLRRLVSGKFRITYLTTKIPAGHLGILRLANSYRLSRVAERLHCLESLNRVRERLGFGQSIILLARRV